MSGYGPMYDAIMASSPIGYWPMTSVTDVVASVAGELISAPTFTGRPLNADIRTSLNSSAQYAAMRIAQTPFAAIVSLELCFIIVGPSTFWRGVIGLQQTSSSSTNEGRVILTTRPADSAMVFLSRDGVITPTAKTYSSLSDRPHHLYMEYDQDMDMTAVFFDGVMTLQYAGNQLANTLPGRYITVGGYYVDGYVGGGSHVSDLALYSRRLTAAEIAARVALVGDPVPVHQLAELRVTGIRWLAGAITKPPQRSDYGHISGAVLRKGDPAPLQLSCFDSKMNLIDTVQADSHGLYRFDNLPLNDRYIIMSIDDSRAEFQPYATDWKTPVPYA